MLCCCACIIVYIYVRLLMSCGGRAQASSVNMCPLLAHLVAALCCKCFPGCAWHQGPLSGYLRLCRSPISWGYLGQPLHATPVDLCWLSSGLCGPWAGCLGGTGAPFPTTLLCHHMSPLCTQVTCGWWLGLQVEVLSLVAWLMWCISAVAWWHVMRLVCDHRVWMCWALDACMCWRCDAVPASTLHPHAQAKLR